MTDGHTSNCSQAISKSTLNELERFSFFLLYCIIVNKSKTISFIRIAKKRLFFGKCYMMGKWHESLAATSDLFPEFPLWGGVGITHSLSDLHILFTLRQHLVGMYTSSFKTYVYPKCILVCPPQEPRTVKHNQSFSPKFRKVSLLSLSL